MRDLVRARWRDDLLLLSLGRNLVTTISRLLVVHGQAAAAGRGSLLFRSRVFRLHKWPVTLDLLEAH